MSETLHPASRFEVRSLKDMVVRFRNGYLPLSGFGIFDLAADGWVSMSAPQAIRGSSEPLHVPYNLRRKSFVEEAVRDGLWPGYNVVRPADVVPLKDVSRAP